MGAMCECGRQGVINRRNKDGSIYYYCPSCKKYFTVYPDEKQPEEEKVIDHHEDPWDETYRTIDGEPYEGKIDEGVKKNKATLKGTLPQSLTAGKVPTQAMMVEWFEVDLDVWVVTKFVPKVWYMGYKDNEGNGRRIPLFGATLYIERRKRIAIDVPPPAIISIPMTANRPAVKKVEGGVGKALFASDFHMGYNRLLKTGELYPFHDRKAISTMVHVALEENIDTLIIGGDLLDLPELTDKFYRDPSTFFTIRPAMVEAKWLFAYLREMLPHTRIIYLEGNHENRFKKYTYAHMVSAFEVTDVADDLPVFSLSHILRFEEQQVEWIEDYPDNAYWLNDGLRCIHGSIVRNDPGKSSQQYALYSGAVSTIYGHIHRSEMVHNTSYNQGEPVETMAFSPGMMGNPEAVPAGRSQHNWQMGFCVIDYERGPGARAFNITPVYMYHDRKVVYKGHEIDAASYLPQLVKDTGWKVYKEN